MVKVEFERRFLADPVFFDTIVAEPILGTKLMHIKASSKKHPKTHNVILDVHADKVIEKHSLSSSKVSACFHQESQPKELVQENGDISLLIRFAIYLSSKPPYTPVTILTTKEREQAILKNPHLEGIRSSVIVKSGTDAKMSIGVYFREYTHAKNSLR